MIALIVPSYAAGAWSQVGGLFALFFGALYILVTLAESEGMSQETSAPVQKPEIAPDTVVEATPAHDAASVSITLPAYEVNERIEMGALELAGMDRR